MLGPVDPFSIVISLVALGVSATTLWLTVLRRGSLRMTQPTVIFFGPDGGDRSFPKVFLRTLLYATGKRGLVVENMFVRLTRGQTSQDFSIWTYGEFGRLSRGSGLYVGSEGVTCDHHFLIPPEGSVFDFLSGDYHIHVFAKLVNTRNTIDLFDAILNIDASSANILAAKNAGIYFDWGPNSGKYHAHIERKPVVPKELAEIARVLSGDKRNSESAERK